MKIRSQSGTKPVIHKDKDCPNYSVLAAVIGTLAFVGLVAVLAVTGMVGPKAESISEVGREKP